MPVLDAPPPVLAPPRPVPASPQAWRAHIQARNYFIIFVIMFGSWLVGELLGYVGFIESPLLHSMRGVRHASFYFVMMFASITLLHLGTRPPRQEWQALSIFGPLVTLAVMTAEPIHQLNLTLADAACIGFGLASITILGMRVARTGGDERARAASLFLLSCMLPLFTVLNPFFQDLTNRLTPTTLDQYAYAADEALGAQFSFVVGQWFEQLPPLRIAAAVIYYTLLFGFLTVLVIQKRRQRPPYLDIFPTLLVTTLLGYTVYLLFPLVGPAVVFGDAFPNAAPAVDAVLSGPLDIPRAPRNCMPSLHTVWVLLIWWHSRPFNRLVRFAAGVYVVFTLLATLGFGFHYLVDLIVAAPFAVIVQAQATPASPETAEPRRRGLLICGVLVIAWLLAIRYGLDLLALSPVLGLAASAATVIVAWREEARIYRAFLGSAAANAEA